MAKKKKSKYIVLSIIGIIAILIVINWGNLKFMFDMMSSYRKYESREETVEKEETHESFDDTNPILEAIEKEKTVESSESTNSEKTDEEKDEKDSSIENNNDEKKDIKNSNTESYVNILSKYNDRFVLLQNDYEGKLNSLISQGYSEYKSGDISKGKLASKYMSQGRALEKESDGKVNALVKEMEEELKSKGLDPSVAKDVKSYYISYKENRRGEIMAKANKAVN